eukprot:m.60221 g.60221  ORF g.60221 m.60221 type:complete len:53 (+) comp7013_c0_seq1:4-162(+)
MNSAPSLFNDHVGHEALTQTKNLERKHVLEAGRLSTQYSAVFTVIPQRWYQK